MVLAMFNLFHVVCAYDLSARDAEIYVNGSSVASTPSSGGSMASVFNSSAPFQLGAISGGNYIDGLIDETGVWSRLLTAEEVTQLYNGGAGLAYPLTPATSSSFLMFM